MRSKRSSETGQALIVIALAAVALFGFMGLAIDGTARYSDRRNAQNAADTAALAAALAKVNAITAGDSNTPLVCTSEDMSTASDVCVELVLAGLDRADSNGYDTANSTVNVYSPPINGYYSTVSNSDDYVQVVITSHVKTTFMRVFGVTQSDNVVNAVAYMKEGRNLTDGAMIIAYDPHPTCGSGVGSGGGSVDISGSSHVTLNGGGIFMNSQEACGFAGNCPDLTITGGAGINSVVSSSVDNIDQDGCSVTAPENFDGEALAIPEDVYWPDVPPECSMSGHPTPYKFPGQILGTDGKMHDQWLIYPGFYTDFPQPALVSNKSFIYMASGVYCIDPPGTQEVTWSTVDAAFLNGSTDSTKNPYASYNPDGVTLYIRQGGGFRINASSPTYLDATSSTSSEYKGYLFILEGNETDHPNCIINGGADIQLNGLIFAPYCEITVDGGSGTVAPINAQLIGWHIKITGTAYVNFNYNPSNQVVLKRRLGLMK